MKVLCTKAFAVSHKEAIDAMCASGDLANTAADGDKFASGDAF